MAGTLKKKALKSIAELSREKLKVAAIRTGRTVVPGNNDNKQNNSPLKLLFILQVF